MIRPLCLLLLAGPATAHVMSMSTGELSISGTRAHYELRIPLYEVSHVKQPEEALLANVKLDGARLLEKNCKPDPPSDSYVCIADYTFRAPVDEIRVECTLSKVTVPNHVHLLHATLNGRREEAVFDSNFTQTTLRFRAPGAAESAVSEAMAGLLRALSGPVQLLFLMALTLATNSRRELSQITGAFFLGQGAAVALLPMSNWQPAPRFVEAAAALTIAYLSVEILLLPKSGTRWLMVGVLGTIHGAWLWLFIQSTHYRAPLILTGAMVGEAAALAVMGWAAAKVSSKRTVMILSSVLLAFGLAWFGMTLR